jgi:hypothetical protein
MENNNSFTLCRNNDFESFEKAIETLAFIETGPDWNTFIKTLEGDLSRIFDTELKAAAQKTNKKSNESPLESVLYHGHGLLATNQKRLGAALTYFISKYGSCQVDWNKWTNSRMDYNSALYISNNRNDSR